MNNKLYTFFAAALAISLWVANSAGPGNVQGIDRTGSPLSPGACDACHSGGNFGPSITAELFDGATQVTHYQANKNYTLRVRVNTTVNASRYGFQAVALTGTANVNAGSFGTAPSGFRRSTIQNRQYAEHASSRTSNTMEFPWTSPATLGEDVRFYAAGLAANNNGGSNGDAAARLSQPLVISPMTSSSEIKLTTKPGLRLLGNPVSDRLHVALDIPEAGNYRISLLQLQGSPVWTNELLLSEGVQNMSWDVAELPGGVYLLLVESRSGRAIVKVVK
jgi:hypothetical protein